MKAINVPLQKNILPKQGFTLIELSIVLVIIGLMVGGVLVGQDLIRAAGARSQIAQIENYKTATNTFRGKYGYLPGDIPATAATQFGFAARGAFQGQGDGNGVLEGCNQYGCRSDNSTAFGHYYNDGEGLLFWNDLGAAQLVNGRFSAGVMIPPSAANSNGISYVPQLYFPQSNINPAGYIVVWSGGVSSSGSCLVPSGGPCWVQTGINHFSIVDPTVIYGSGMMTSRQAYSIDTKIDDGSPTTGKVQAKYPYEFTGSSAGVFSSGTNSSVSGEWVFDMSADTTGGVATLWWQGSYGYSTFTTPVASTCFYYNNTSYKYAATSLSSSKNCTLTFDF
jgi:prepilin-type N-terminal cleavage/methylation domain-containing protein